MKRLYHVSDNFNITEFVPRPVRKEVWGDIENSVWSVDNLKLQNYLLPRDCPRVCWTVNAELNEEDKLWIEKMGSPNTVIFVQKEYKKEINNTELIVYEFDPKSFYLIDESAGYYISHKIEIPVGARIVHDVERELELMHTRIVYVDDLKEIAEQSVKRSFTYSNIRMGMLE